MALQITGTLFLINETVQITETFQKREFVLQVVNGDYTEYVKFQTAQAKTSLLDAFGGGETVTVHFNIKGKPYTKNGVTDYFNNLDAWKIESGEGQQPQPKQAAPKQAAPANTSARDNVMAAQKMKEAAKPKEEETFEDDLPF